MESKMEEDHEAVAFGMTDLPLELIAHILSALDFKDLLKCRQVCKLWDSMIRSSKLLQYRITLGINGLCDPDDLTTVCINARQSLLDEYLDAWDNLRFDQVGLIDVLSSNKRRHELQGNVLAQITEDDSLVITRIPSRIRSIEGRTWTLDQLHVSIDDFTFDSAQNLLVLSEKRDFEKEGICLHLRSLDTGDVHSLAASDILSYRREPVECDLNPDGDLQICSEYVAMSGSCSAVGKWPGTWETQSVICVWNWRTGELVLELIGPFHTYSFLTDRHIVLIRTTYRSYYEADARDPYDADITVIDFTTTPRGEQSLYKIAYTCCFHFPALYKDIAIDVANICSEPARTSPRDYGCMPFRTDAKRKVLSVSLYYHEVTPQMSSDQYGSDVIQEIIFVIPATTLLRHFYDVPDLPPNFEVDWEDWGPTGTRVYQITGQGADAHNSNAFGTRIAEIDLPSVQPQDGLSIFIYDYNQLPIRKSLKEGAESNVHAFTNENKFWTVIPRDNSHGCYAFQELLNNNLPYRCGEILLPHDGSPWPYEGIMLGEDIIVVLEGATKKFRIFSL